MMLFQLLKALRGDSGIIECGFVASDITEAKYFSTPLELGVGRVLLWTKASFPLIAKANSQAHSECFQYCDWLKVLAASLRVGFCDEWKRAITQKYGRYDARIRLNRLSLTNLFYSQAFNYYTYSLIAESLSIK